MKQAVLGEETKIPLKWVFLLLSASGSALIVAMGVAVYAGRVDSRVESTAERLTALEGEKREEMTYLRRIEERLSRIEGKLDQ